MSWEDMADPVALAHRSRTGHRAHANGLAPLVAADVQAVMSDGWLPNPEDLGETSSSMDWMSSASSTAASRRRWPNCGKSFSCSGTSSMARTRAGSSCCGMPTGRARSHPTSDPRTPEDERARRRGELEERLRAAQLAAIEWAQHALIALRESAPVWLATVAESPAAAP